MSEDKESHEPRPTHGSRINSTEDEDYDNSILVLNPDTSDFDEEETEAYGPVLPPAPKPPASEAQLCLDDNESSSPALPSGQGMDLKKRVYGPTRPSKHECDKNKQSYGPALPPRLTAKSSSQPVAPSVQQDLPSDDEGYGPMPIPQGADLGSKHIEVDLDRRATSMKRKLVGKNQLEEHPQRESWMLELPPDKAADFGLGPRQFRARAKLEAGDRSVWTDTPSDKLQKKDKEDYSGSVDEMKQLAVLARDEEMEHLVDKHTKKQDSLLAMHQKKLKKSKKKEETGKVRRPFDRDVDLQVNRFDEAQKKSIFKKAQLLNDRFSTGESKFL